MKIFLIVSFFTVSNMMQAMDEPQRGKIYQVPAVANKYYRETTKGELLRIAPDHLLKDEGMIEFLIIRPEKEQRAYLRSVGVKLTHIHGDKNGAETELQDLAAVTMMRADASHAFGGAHLPGDNIHVSGMRMGKQYLEVGDILTIIDAQNMVNTILLKTHIPHQACWKFASRCGQEAFDFCNNEGEYENGLLGPNGKLDGVEQRLRGIRLAVLKGGLISEGNRVVIERGQTKEKRLAEFALGARAAELVTKSREPGLKFEAEDIAKAKIRKEARLRKSEQNTRNGN